MATVTKLQKHGDTLAALFSDGSRYLATDTGQGVYLVSPNPNDLSTLQLMGGLVLLSFDGGQQAFAYPSGNDIWYIGPTEDGGPVDPPPADLIDTVSPGHHVTNPGGTVAAGWAWHLAHNSGRGGVDWNYNFQDFTAPGSGTVDHFNVAGVGMVVRLTLDTPAARINPQLTNDAFGPMRAIWYQHCSASVDGHHAQGEVIGTSGNGYGAYAPHLHVHGVVSGGARCNFWGFV